VSLVALRVLFYGACVASATAVLGVCAVGFFSMGDPFVGYTVVNDTNRKLLTWLHIRDCSKLIGYKGEYSDAERIAPGGVVNYFQVGFRDGCVQVATLDRRVIVAQDYRTDLVIRVKEPVTFLTEPVPPEDKLPKAPHSSPLERFTTHANWQTRTVEVLLAALLVGVVVGLVSGNALRRRDAVP
jgi:hypothetical protein